MRFKIKTTRNCFVDITDKKRQLIIHAEYFDANNIFSHPFIQNLKRKPNMIHDMSRKIKISLKKQIGEQCQTSNTTNHTYHQQEW